MILPEYLAAKAEALALPEAERVDTLRRLKSARQRTLDADRRQRDPAWWAAKLVRNGKRRHESYVPVNRPVAPRAATTIPFRPDLVPIDANARDGRVQMVADMHGARCLSARYVAGKWLFPTCSAHLGFEPEFYLP